MSMHRSVVLSALALALGACFKPMPAIRPEVVVQQQGLTIEGLAGGPLTTGATYRPTSYAPAMYHSGNAQYTTMLNTFKRFGQNVRVRVPGREEPLYGLISFHDLPGYATGPGSRSYAISVPQSYVDQATNGRVSVVYELVPAPIEGRRFEALGWVLFLSDRPL